MHIETQSSVPRETRPAGERPSKTAVQQTTVRTTNVVERRDRVLVGVASTLVPRPGGTVASGPRRVGDGDP